MAMDSENIVSKKDAEGGQPKSGIARLNTQYQPPSSQALQCVPEDVARKYNVIPLSVDNNAMRVCMSNLSDIMIIENLSIYTKKRIVPVYASEADIKEAIDYNYSSIFKNADRLNTLIGSTTVAGEQNAISDAVGDSSVGDILDRIVEDAMKSRASDIHVEPDETKVRVRFRIDGILHESATLPLSVHNQLISRIKILSDLNIADHRRPQDGQFSFESEKKRVDIRVATINTIHGEMCVMRLLDKSLAVLSLQQLGFLRESQEKFEKMLMMPYGMALISGPTGAGKTTTLYAAVNSLDSVGRNIITIEDPVEYHVENINQIQVNAKAGLTFASGLRSIVRLDPDVILVGEIRDGETAQIAVQSALTGHLVMSSVHANDTIGVLFRLIDLGVESFLLSSALIGIVAQRMVRKVCPHCARKVTVPLAEQVAYEKELNESKSEFVYGTGCKECVNTGYLGRTGLFEILMISDEIRRLIVAGAGSNEIRTVALSEGLIPIARDGMLKSKAGITTPYEVLRNAYSIS